jgi:hypothetical protein
MLFVLGAKESPELMPPTVGKLEILHEQVEHVYHELGEVLHYVRAAKGDAAKISPVMDKCLQQIHQMLNPQREAQNLAVVLEIPATGAVEGSEPAETEHPPDAIKVSNTQLELLTAMFDMDVGVSSVDAQLFQFLYGELGPLPTPGPEPAQEAPA